MTLLFSRHTGPLNMGIFAFVSLHTASPSQACMYVPSSTTVSGGAELSYPPLPRPRPPPGDRPPNPPRPPGDRPPPRPAGGLIESQRMRLWRTGARWNCARHASGCGRRALGSEAERGEVRGGLDWGLWRRPKGKTQGEEFRGGSRAPWLISSSSAEGGSLVAWNCNYRLPGPPPSRLSQPHLG